MKRTVLFFVVTIMLFFGGLSLMAQDQPAPKKDTVNIDTEAKPEFYYQVEDDASAKTDSNSSIVMIVIVAAGVVLVVGGVAYFLVKKKK